jgi:uncharacterized membrane protein
VKAEAFVPVPAAAVTVTVTEPAVPEGSFTVSLVDVLVVIEVAVLLPNLTEITVVKLVPMIVTVVPPASGPLEGETLVIETPAEYVKADAFVPVPPTAVTETVTAPAEPDGVFTVILVGVFVVMVAVLVPNLTEVAVVKFEPVIVTVVPPAWGPLEGDRVVITGLAT